MPTEVEQDGLPFRLHSEVVGPDWRLGVSATNVSDEVVDRLFPGRCMLTELVAFREGEFAEPAWKSVERRGQRGCSTDAIPIRLEPDESVEPDRWRVELPVASVVADRLEAGLYRFGGRVAVGRAIGGETVTMVAPGPLRLERCFPVPCPESSATAEDELPFPTEVEESGLRSRARSELTDCGTRWRLWLAVTNVANAAVTAEFPKRCMVTRLVAFREGEFGEPVWRATHAGPCEETRRTGFPLQPGETFKPFSWEDNVQVETILGDSLEVGFYRFGSERVEVDGEIGGNAARMIGPVPLRLERSP